SQRRGTSPRWQTTRIQGAYAGYATQCPFTQRAKRQLSKYQNHFSVFFILHLSRNFSGHNGFSERFTDNNSCRTNSDIYASHFWLDGASQGFDRRHQPTTVKPPANQLGSE